MDKERRVLEAEEGLEPRTASHGPFLTLELSPMLIPNSGRGGGLDSCPNLVANLSSDSSQTPPTSVG